MLNSSVNYQESKEIESGRRTVDDGSCPIPKVFVWFGLEQSETNSNLRVKWRLESGICYKYIRQLTDLKLSLKKKSCFRDIETIAALASKVLKVMDTFSITTGKNQFYYLYILVTAQGSNTEKKGYGLSGLAQILCPPSWAGD